GRDDRDRRVTVQEDGQPVREPEPFVRHVDPAVLCERRPREDEERGECERGSHGHRSVAWGRSPTVEPTWLRLNATTIESDEMAQGCQVGGDGCGRGPPTRQPGEVQ